MGRILAFQSGVVAEALVGHAWAVAKVQDGRPRGDASRFVAQLLFVAKELAGHQAVAGMMGGQEAAYLERKQSVSSIVTLPEPLELAVESLKHGLG